MCPTNTGMPQGSGCCPQESRSSFYADNIGKVNQDIGRQFK